MDAISNVSTIRTAVQPDPVKIAQSRVQAQPPVAQSPKEDTSKTDSAPTPDAGKVSAGLDLEA